MEEVSYEPKLCVYARYFADEGLAIKVGLTRRISDHGPGFISIPEANVRLIRSDGKVCLDTVISFVEKKAFIDINKFSLIPQCGDSLTIVVKADSYEPVIGKTIVPLAVPIDSILVKKYYTDTKMYRFTLFFTDQESDNFYLVSSVYSATTFFFSSAGYKEPYDTAFSKFRYAVYLTDPVFDFMPDFRTSVKEPFDNSIRKPRIFSDTGFRNSQYGLNIEVPVWYSFNKPNEKHYSSYNIELYSISKDLFEAFKSSYLNEIIDGDIYAEPVYIYSNMSNKVGFFGAYGKKSVSTVQIDDEDMLKLDTNQNPEYYM